MKKGVRAIGVAESFVHDYSTLAGVVVRADRVVDGFAFGSCTVGGTDATERILDLLGVLDREDVQYVFVAGIAPAWFNIIDLATLFEEIDRPIISVTFEESDGLAKSLTEHFTGNELRARLQMYESQPERRAIEVNNTRVYIRCIGLSMTESRPLLRQFTPEGGRPEPVRLARLAARAADRWRRTWPQQ